MGVDGAEFSSNNKDAKETYDFLRPLNSDVGPGKSLDYEDHFPIVHLAKKKGKMHKNSRASRKKKRSLTKCRILVESSRGAQASFDYEDTKRDALDEVWET